MLLLDPAPLLASLLLALALDALAGDPDWLYRRLPHPVVVIGRGGRMGSARCEMRTITPIRNDTSVQPAKPRSCSPK